MNQCCVMDRVTDLNREIQVQILSPPYCSLGKLGHSCSELCEIAKTKRLRVGEITYIMLSFLERKPRQKNVMKSYN